MTNSKNLSIPCEISVSTEIDASVDRVWQAVSDFGAIDRYATGITDCRVDGEGIGAIRTLKVSRGIICERLETMDHGTYSLSYTQLATPLPIDACLNQIELSALGQGRCQLHWRAAFEPVGIAEKDAKKMLTAVYASTVEGLRKLVVAVQDPGAASGDGQA